MNVAIRDRDTLMSIHPVLVGAYLQSRGWTRVDSQPNRYSLWAKPSGSAQVELLLPLDSNLGDFAERIAELLRDLQQEEGRSEIELLRDIEASACDLFRFRKEPHSGFRGAIPIEDGVRFVQYARDMLLYAASAEHAPRSFITGRRSEDVVRFMSRALLGQTEVGSFVVTAQVPVPARLQGELFAHEAIAGAAEPFERRAGVRLMNLLRQAREAALEAAQTNDIQPFVEALRFGGSFNLYSTLVEAQEIVPGEPLEVSCTWASSRPLVGPPPAALVSFEPEIVPPIRAAVDALRPRSPKEGFSLFGYVELLRREVQEPLIGDLAMTALVDDKVRKIYFSLQQPEYDQAIKAFQERRPIEVVGDLVKVSNRWELQQPRNLVVHPGPEAVPEEEETSSREA